MRNTIKFLLSLVCLSLPAMAFAQQGELSGEVATLAVTNLGEGLITRVDQLSSPYTDTGESIGLAGLIDGDLDCHIPQDISAHSFRFTKAGDYTSADSGNILTEDGGAVVAAEGISPFVYLFDTTFELGNLDGVNEILSAPNAADNTVYDLSGRHLTKVTKPGVYIVNGVKTFLR